MAYIGNDVRSNEDYKIIDDISSGFNGSATSFALQVGGATPVPFPKFEQQLLISVNGVIQEPDPTGSAGFKLTGTNIVFSSAPTGGHSFFGVIYAGADYVNAGGSFPDGSINFPSITFGADTDTGFTRTASGTVALISNGTKVAQFPTGQGSSGEALITDGAGNLSFGSPTSAFGNITLGDSIIHDGDTNTKIRFPAADTVSVETGGSERLRVNSSGDVGIGTSSPSDKLVVSAANSQLRLIDSDDSSFVQFSYSGGKLITRNNSTSTTTAQFTLDGSGRLGIGTISPGRQLEVNSDSANTFIRIRSSDTGNAGFEFGDQSDTVQGAIFQNSSDNSLRFNGFNNAERMRIDSSGNVGIGTSSPSTILHVKGNTGDMLRLDRDNTGSVGNQIAFRHSNSGTLQETASINCVSTANAGAGQLRFNTKTSGGSNTEKMRIENDGKVGIGTTSPDTPVHISANDAQLLTVQRDGNNNASIRFRNQTSSMFCGLTSGATGFAIDDDDNLVSDPMLFVQRSDGNVGIGTIPNEKLVVNGNSSVTGALFITSNTSTPSAGAFLYRPASNELALGTNSTERMRIDSSGRFLIAKGTESTTTSQFQIGESSGGYSWDVGDTPQVLISGVNNEAPTNGGSRNIALRVEDENSNVMFQVSNTGGGNNDVGRVGIGTAVPDAMLHLRSNGVSIIRLSDGDTSGENDSTIGRIDFETEDSNNPGVAANIHSRLTDTTNGACSLSFATGTPTTLNTRMLISSAGNVGINTTSPISHLQIGDSTIDAGNVITFGKRVAGSNSNLPVIGHHSDGTGSGIGICATSSAGKIHFFTGNNSSGFGSGDNNERMRIDVSGNVLIATTSTTVNSSNFGIVLGSDGSGGFFKNTGGSSDVFRAGGNAGLANIFGDGDITNTNNSYGQASDETLKQDIVDAASQWNDIKNLRVRKFRFKDNPTGVLQIGVVAQEIEKVSAGLVQEDEEGIKSVKYSVLYMKAVKCLQEAIAKIETLETKVAALEAA